VFKKRSFNIRKDLQKRRRSESIKMKGY
jgi:hypothetical protein